MNETYGYGAIIIALIGLLTKVWLDGTKNAQKMIEVVEKNATAIAEFKAATEANTKATEKNTDHLTRLVLKVVKSK